MFDSQFDMSKIEQEQGRYEVSIY